MMISPEILIESAPGAIVMVNVDGIILQINGETVKMFGYQREEMLHQPVEMLLPERFRSAHTQNRGAYQQQPQIRLMQ